MLNWNDNFAAAFEAKLTFKHWSLSIVSIRAVDTVLRGMYGDLNFELISGFSIQFFEKGEIAWENGIKTVYDIYRFWTSTSRVILASFTKTWGFYL